MRGHDLRARLMAALTVAMYSEFREAALRLASEISQARRGRPVSGAVWQGMLTGRRLNEYLEAALIRLTGASRDEISEKSYQFSKAEIEKRLRVQAEIWAAQDAELEDAAEIDRANMIS